MWSEAEHTGFSSTDNSGAFRVAARTLHGWPLKAAASHVGPVPPAFFGKQHKGRRNRPYATIRNIQMPDIDTNRLKDELVKAGRSAFAEFRSNHSNESFYCMGLFTSGDLVYVVATAMTEQGLDRVFRKYRDNPIFADESDAELLLSLRWNPCDSPLHGEGVAFFESVQPIMNDVRARLDEIDTDLGWDEFNTFTATIDNCLCEALEQLDREGVFGTGTERERVFVTIMMGDQDNTIVDFGRRLNPRSTFERFRREWDAFQSQP